MTLRHPLFATVFGLWLLAAFAAPAQETEATKQPPATETPPAEPAGKLDAKAIEELTESTEKALEEKKKHLGKTDVERQKLLIEKEAMEKQLRIKEEELKLKQKQIEEARRAAKNQKDREAARKAASEAQKLERETRKLRKEFASMEKELALRKKEARLAIAESAAKAEEIKALKEELDKLNAQRAALLSAEKKTFLFLAIVLGTLLAILLKNLLVGRLDRRLAPGEFSERNVRRLRFLTLMRIANWVLSVVFVMVGGFMVLKLFGFSLTTTLAGAGVLGMALGFGGQYVIRDMFAGLSIVLEGQYSMNDIIRIGEHQGVVEDVNLRFTRLRNLDGTVVYIPNGEVKTVMNFSKEFAQATVALYLDYATDIDGVLALIERIVDEVRSDDRFRRLVLGGVDLLGIHKFTPTGPKIRFRVKTLPGEQWRVARELRLRLKKGMDQQGLRFFRFAPEQHQAQLADASG